MNTAHRPRVPLAGLAFLPSLLAQPIQQVRAYCFDDGVIFFGADVPQGAIELVRGEPHQLRERLRYVARHGITPGSLLVPGVPEAEDAREAAAALARWINQCAANSEHLPDLVWNCELKVAL